MNETTKATHTPGPWIPNQFDPDSPWTVISEGDAFHESEWVCKVSSDGNWARQHPKTIKANAHLLAAAPDLLAALQAIEAELAALQQGTALASVAAVTRALIEKQREKARAAIAKAKGGAS